MLFQDKRSKNFLGKGHSPLPDPTVSGEGDTPSPSPRHLAPMVLDTHPRKSWIRH